MSEDYNSEFPTIAELKSSGISLLDFIKTLTSIGVIDLESYYPSKNTPWEKVKPVGVRLWHKKSGIAAQCVDHRNMHENLNVAYSSLVKALKESKMANSPYCTFDDFWSSTYAETFGQEIIEAAFKEVAEATWLAATVAAAQVCGELEGNAEETGMASNFDCEVAILESIVDSTKAHRPGDAVMVKFTASDDNWTNAVVDKIHPNGNTITVSIGEGEKTAQVSIFRKPYQHELKAWPTI